MSKKISSRLTAVVFAAALTLAGTVEASSSWSLAWDWLTEVWGGLTGRQGTTAASGVEWDGTCSNCSNNEHGWGIDPNGGTGG